MKKVKIIVILIAILLILGCASFATLYFTTDIFKSDKEMFFKYISQIDLNETTDSNQYAKYQERLKTQKYKNEGNVSINLNMDEEIKEKFEYISKVDLANNVASSNVTINRAGNNLLTIDYLKNEDLYGLKFNEIVSQYITFNNNNLQEFALKFGIEDVESIPNKIEIPETSTSINQEELKQIYNKYIDIIIEQIPSESYSKVENGYKLTIDLKTLQKIILRTLNTLKDDEQVFNLLNSIVEIADSSEKLSFEEYQEALTSGIEELSEEIDENFNIINIVVYEQGGIYVKIGVESEEEQEYVEVTIEKEEDKIISKLNIINKSEYENTEVNCNISKNINTQEQENFEIEIKTKEDEEEFCNINITTSRNGNLTADIIENAIAISAIFPEDDLEMDIEYNSKKTFDSSLEIEEFNQSNHAVINELSAEQINNLITNLGNRITQKSGANVVEIVGGAGVGIISTLPMDSQEIAMIGGAVVGTGISIYTTASNSLFDISQNATQKTRNAQVEEAIILAKTDVMSEYYTTGNTLDITEEELEKRIEEYLGDDEMLVEVTKIEGEQKYTVIVYGTDIDEKYNSILDLSRLNN